MAILPPDGGRPEIVGVGVAPNTGVKKGVVVDLEATTQAISEATERAQRMAGLDVRAVLAGVSGQHIASQNSKGVIAVMQPESGITREDVERVLDAAKLVTLPPERDIIHAIPRSFSIDGAEGISSPIGMSGVRLEVETHLVTGTSTLLSNVTKCIERAGLDVEEIVLQPLASAEACLTQAERDLGVVALDIGGGTTDIAMFVNGAIFYSAVVPLGGNHLTYDIAVGLRTSQEEAERIKISSGGARPEQVPDESTVVVHSPDGREERKLPRRILAEIMEPRLQEIFLHVRREIGKSGYDDLLGAGCVVTGGSSQVPHIAEVASEILAMPARLGTPQNVGGLSDSVSSPTFSSAVGLVLYGVNQRRSGLYGSEDGFLGGARKKAVKLFAGLFGRD